MICFVGFPLSCREIGTRDSSNDERSSQSRARKSKEPEGREQMKLELEQIRVSKSSGYARSLIEFEWRDGTLNGK